MRLMLGIVVGLLLLVSDAKAGGNTSWHVGGAVSSYGGGGFAFSAGRAVPYAQPVYAAPAPVPVHYERIAPCNHSWTHFEEPIYGWQKRFSHFSCSGRRVFVKEWVVKGYRSVAVCGHCHVHRR